MSCAYRGRLSCDATKMACNNRYQAADRGHYKALERNICTSFHSCLRRTVGFDIKPLLSYQILRYEGQKLGEKRQLLDLRSEVNVPV
jgi:hypothetical protein